MDRSSQTVHYHWGTDSVHGTNVITTDKHYESSFTTGILVVSLQGGGVLTFCMILDMHPTSKRALGIC